MHFKSREGPNSKEGGSADSKRGVLSILLELREILFFENSVLSSINVWQFEHESEKSMMTSLKQNINCNTLRA